MKRAKASAMILQISNPDLAADPAARRAIKDETVWVEFADVAGELTSGVGVNRYSPGDALVTGSTGDRWSVSRGRFDAKYDPEPPTVRGVAGHYRNRPSAVLAKCIEHSFTVARTAGGDCLYGVPGDWLIQYAPGDYGIVASARFKRVYRLITDEDR